MRFSKTGPDPKRLGPLTPRVRERYAGLGLLRFESMNDSLEAPDMPPSQELVQLLMQFLADTGAQQAPGVATK